MKRLTHFSTVLFVATILSCANYDVPEPSGIANDAVDSSAHVGERPPHHLDFVHDGKKYRLSLSVNRSKRNSDRKVLVYIKASGRVWAFDRRTGRYDHGLGGSSSEKSFQVFVEGGKLKLLPSGGSGGAGYSGIDGWLAGVDITVAPPHEIASGLTVDTEELDIHATIEFNLISEKSDSDGERTILEAVETKLTWNASLDPSSANGFRLSDQGSATQAEPNGEQDVDSNA